MEFNEGFVLLSNYQRLLKTSEFKEIEVYSNLFLESNKDVLLQYGHKWVSDPLHQWSRQWEYPYVFSRINKYLQTRDNPKVLDAGSGLTFFPYLISDKISNSTITCCDYDINLKKLYDKINNKNSKNVSFVSADLRKTPFMAKSFDVIYCISVLEHTKNYREILGEFSRILTENGLLIVTFDISIDGKSEINFSGFKKLIADISEKFVSIDSEKFNEISDCQQLPLDIICTHHFRKVNAKLLPWKFPILYSIFHSIRKGQMPDFKLPNLTCACFSFLK
jgi:ubiquinone/menaquinone biosynthesis C-methylase UbiE